jgi:NitT/TauT family transport system substrate-binding protein
MRLIYRLFFSALFLAALGMGSVATANAADPGDVRLQLKWIHQAQFAGNYVADQLGYYRNEGIRISLIAGGPGINPSEQVLAGKAEFGVAASDQLIKLRLEGKPVVALATIFQRNPLVFVSPKRRGITDPKQFAGKTIRATSNHELLLRAVMRNVGIDRDQYKTIVLPSKVDTFLGDEADVWSAYLTGLVTTLELAGHPLNIVFPDDYGVHFYGDTLFTLADYAAANPDIVRGFLRATIKGWQTAITDPDGAARIIVSYNSDLDPAAEATKLIASVPLIDTGGECIGSMRPETWQNMIDTMLELRIIDKKLDAGEFAATEYMKEICSN